MGQAIHPAAVAVVLALGAGTAAGAQTATRMSHGGFVVAGAADVTRDLGALSPDFRVRLERVLDRMTREFGPGIEVTETWRSQTRQDALYAQGRTTRGPVVTWTRSSAHLSGYAADLKIESAYVRRGAYRRLAAIARAEGLRTLGPRDPGHLEMRGAAARMRAASAHRRAPAPPAGSSRALSRIVVSSPGTARRSEPTVFAASPYVGIMSAPRSFSSVAPPTQATRHTGLTRDGGPR